jgi:CspA family cold shock protein
MAQRQQQHHYLVGKRTGLIRIARDASIHSNHSRISPRVDSTPELKPTPKNPPNMKGAIMTVGTVKWFDSVKGYGFVQPDDGSKDAFVHISAVERAGLSTLNEGQKIQYDLVPGRNGKSAADNLVILD